jgi:hypothetical protein
MLFCTSLILPIDLSDPFSSPLYGTVGGGLVVELLANRLSVVDDVTEKFGGERTGGSSLGFVRKAVDDYAAFAVDSVDFVEKHLILGRGVAVRRIVGRDSRTFGRLLSGFSSTLDTFHLGDDRGAPKHVHYLTTAPYPILLHCCPQMT